MDSIHRSLKARKLLLTKLDLEGIPEEVEVAVAGVAAEVEIGEEVDPEDINKLL
jgi:hypothetical protein